MRTAVCAIVKNEAADLPEWLAYHLAIGFETIIVFDNGSTDETATILQDYAKIYDVRRVDWPITTPTYQMEAYNAALTQFRAEFDWLCFIDADEFIVLMSDATMNDFLGRFPTQAAIAVNWAIFGSSGHQAAPKGLVIENFLHRSESAFAVNRHVKSFVRPPKTQLCENPHFFQIEGDYVTADQNLAVWQSPGIVQADWVPGLIQINHYFVKSAEQWARKMARGYHDVERTGLEFAAYDRNEVEDRAVLRFAETTKRIMQTVSALPMDPGG